MKLSDQRGVDVLYISKFKLDFEKKRNFRVLIIIHAFLFFDLILFIIIKTTNSKKEDPE